MTLKRIWVLAESFDNTPIGTTNELLTCARSLAEVVEAVTWNADIASLAPLLGAYGAKKVYNLGDLGSSMPGVVVSQALHQLIQSGNVPDAIFVPSTYDGRDIAGRLSVRIDRPVLTNIVGLFYSADSLITQHTIFGGTKILTARFTGELPGIYVIRAKSFAAEPVQTGSEQEVSQQEVETVEVGELGPTNLAHIESRHVEQRSGPKLEEAPVVVAGGRGLGDAESYGMIEELAKLLNGAPGASRAIVDQGWVPYSYQVGQTGKTVKPVVYIACGISGATQHMVGMKGAKNIIAINKDAEAAIFSIADLGIVGDVKKVLPKLIEAIKSAR
ncbi:MAG: electron transfer flavoprotein subunit alpha/FixB family protein [Actinobacteria bacterium]|nr:electron transfer flavoprotein subunit alpha/FixB family protein [Actinomycetota bacterium]MCL6105553.1 electron transfer flavoprotein subunit alpha/FixB family protein [Actinomycetota bacterium]